MATKKNVKVANTLGKLTPQQSKELANSLNGGLGSGKAPAKKSTGKATGKKK